MAFGNPGWRATHNPGLSYLTPSALRAVHAIPIDFIAKINPGWLTLFTIPLRVTE
jgi:hypothetical protein